MRTIEELYSLYELKHSAYAYRNKKSQPEPILLKTRMLHHLQTNELTFDEYDLLVEHHNKIKKAWSGYQVELPQMGESTFINQH